MKINNLKELKQLREMLKKETMEEMMIRRETLKMYFFMGAGAKISAIKLRRKITGDGLRESKDWVEKEMGILEALQRI